MSTNVCDSNAHDLSIGITHTIDVYTVTRQSVYENLKHVMNFWNFNDRRIIEWSIYAILYIIKGVYAHKYAIKLREKTK